MKFLTILSLILLTYLATSNLNARDKFSAAIQVDEMIINENVITSVNNNNDRVCQYLLCMLACTTTYPCLPVQALTTTIVGAGLSFLHPLGGF